MPVYIYIHMFIARFSGVQQTTDCVLVMANVVLVRRRLLNKLKTEFSVSRFGLVGQVINDLFTTFVV